jgi:CRISPR-associated protein Cas1
MVNEFCYCPRLFYLEWVEAQFQPNADTATGSFVHEAVDRGEGRAPEPEEIEELKRATSVTLSSETLGLIATIDVLEQSDGKAIPIDHKKGRPPLHGPAWEPELVQLCVQGLVLRENGYECDEGIIYYNETRERRSVEFDEQLIGRTVDYVRQLREVAAGDEIPPPLVDSPKCPRCSLVGICLPDETNLLTERSTAEPRRLLPREQAAHPLYVTEQGAYVGLRSGRVRVTRHETQLAEVRMLDVSQVNVIGNVQLSTQFIRECFRREVPILWFSYGGWFSGIAEGLPSKNVELRRRQTAVASQAGLPVAQAIVAGKITNCRTLLRRNTRSRDDGVLKSLKDIADSTHRAPSLESLLGFEGTAARLYFGQFGTMLNGELDFDFAGRNRRPPRDSVNCLLSFVYGLLVKDLTIICLGVGLDPYLGFYHRPRFGRPALALDLAEEFRPIIGDSVTINVINNGEVRPSSFIKRATGVALTPDGRKAVIAAYERRLDTTVTHPMFGYKVAYRRIMEVQARLLAAYLVREVGSYQAFTTR